MYSYTITTQSNTESIITGLPPSKHDNHAMPIHVGRSGTYPGTLTRYPAQRDQRPVAINDNDWRAAKETIIGYAGIVQGDKADIDAIFYCRFADNAPDKSYEYVIDRTTITLDFDAPGFDAGAAMQILIDRNICFAAYTTHSSGKPGKGTRMRIVIPTAETYKIDDWGTADREDGINCYRNLPIYFKSIGFVDALAVDPSAYNISQYQAAPAINPEVGYVNVWINDDDDTNLFSIAQAVESIPVDKRHVAKTRRAPTIDPISQPATEVAAGAESDTLSDLDRRLIVRCKIDPALRQAIVDMVLSTSWLTRSTYQSTGLDEHGANDKRLTLASMCCALQAIDCTLAQWRLVYKHMISSAGRYDQTADEIWRKQWSRPNKLILSIAHPQIMKLHHKKLFGYIADVTDYDAYRAERMAAETIPDTKSVQYLDPADLTSDAAVTVIIGDTGIGKTTAVRELADIASADVVIAVPTQLIRDQQDHESIQTYDSVHKIKGGEAEKKIAAIDEIHNLPRMSYRANATVKTYNRIVDNALEYDKIILMSATLDAATAQMIGNMNCRGGKVEIIKRTKTNAPIKYYKVREYNIRVDQTAAIATAIMDELAMKRKVYVINDNGRINDEIGELLEQMDVKAMIVSRDRINKNKTTEVTTFDNALYDFTTTSDFEMGNHNLDVIVSTRIACEGVNVCDDLDDVAVIVTGDLDPTYIRQTAGRFRCAKKVFVNHLQMQSPNKQPDIQAYVDLQRVNIATAIANASHWAINHPAANKTDWARYGSTGIKIETNYKQSWLERGVYFDEDKNQICDVRPIAELILHAEVDKAKFYRDIKCQEIYMNCAGFVIAGNDEITPASDLIALAEEVKTETKDQCKRSTAEKADIFGRYLDRLFAKIGDAPIKGGNIDKVATKLMIDRSVVIKINNLVKSDERKKWLINAALEDWSCHEIEWQYASDTSEIVREIKGLYPADTFLRPIDCGDVAEAILKSQMRRLVDYGVTDIAHRLRDKGSVWDGYGDKIDVATGTITDKARWASWVSSNGFLGLEKKKRKIDGKAVDGYIVV